MVWAAQLSVSVLAGPARPSRITDQVRRSAPSAELFLTDRESQDALPRSPRPIAGTRAPRSVELRCTSTHLGGTQVTYSQRLGSFKFAAVPAPCGPVMRKCDDKPYRR